MLVKALKVKRTSSKGKWAWGMHWTGQSEEAIGKWVMGLTVAASDDTCCVLNDVPRRGRAERDSGPATATALQS